jgi:hypothetical protein
MKMYEGYIYIYIYIYIHIFLNSVTVGGEGSALRPGRYTPNDRATDTNCADWAFEPVWRT